MNNQVILKISNRVYKSIENQTDIETVKYFLPFSCEINIQEFFKNI
mgnify:CR=1 FL=1